MYEMYDMSLFLTKNSWLPENTPSGNEKITVVWWRFWTFGTEMTKKWGKSSWNPSFILSMWSKKCVFILLWCILAFRLVHFKPCASSWFSSIMNLIIFLSITVSILYVAYKYTDFIWQMKQNDAYFFRMTCHYLKEMITFVVNLRILFLLCTEKVIIMY